MLLAAIETLNIFGGGCQATTRFNILNFDNPFSYYYTPNNYLTNSSLLMLITLNATLYILMLMNCELKNKTRP